MTLYNYTSIMQRDTKIYAIGGVGIPGGVSVTHLKVILPVVFLFLFVGSVVAWPLGIRMWNIMNNWNWQYFCVWLALGLSSGLILWNVQFAGYRLFEYLLAYLRPRKCYTNSANMNNRTYNHTNIYIDSTVHTVL